jgi:ferritin-like metal-binding protein YciE
MTTAQDKITQYLHEAQTLELTLVRTLQTHRTMTPEGPYRGALDRHLRETRAHADAISHRLRELDAEPSLLDAGYDLAQRLVGQVLALGKAPLDLVRGSSAEEKLLRNAKDECASEAMEIATYDTLEQLARQAGDVRTAELAAEHRADEERMLATLREQLPVLTAGVVATEVLGASSYDPGTTAAGQAARTAAGGELEEAGRIVAGTGSASANEERIAQQQAARERKQSSHAGS